MSHPAHPSQPLDLSSLSVPQIYLGCELLAGFVIGAWGVHSDAKVYAHQGNLGLVGGFSSDAVLVYRVVGELNVVDVLDRRLGVASAGPHEGFANEAVAYD